MNTFKSMALMLGCLLTSTVPCFAAGPVNHLQTFGRWIGCGYGDGYHACRQRDYRFGDSLPIGSVAAGCCGGGVGDDGYGAGCFGLNRDALRSGCDSKGWDAGSCDASWIPNGINCHPGDDGSPTAITAATPESELQRDDASRPNMVPAVTRRVTRLRRVDPNLAVQRLPPL